MDFIWDEKIRIRMGELFLIGRKFIDGTEKETLIQLIRGELSEILDTENKKEGFVRGLRVRDDSILYWEREEVPGRSGVEIGTSICPNFGCERTCSQLRLACSIHFKEWLVEVEGRRSSSLQVEAEYDGITPTPPPTALPRSSNELLKSFAAQIGKEIVEEGLLGKSTKSNSKRTATELFQEQPVAKKRIVPVSSSSEDDSDFNRKFGIPPKNKFHKESKGTEKGLAEAKVDKTKQLSIKESMERLEVIKECEESEVMQIADDKVSVMQNHARTTPKQSRTAKRRNAGTSKITDNNKNVEAIPVTKKDDGGGANDTEKSENALHPPEIVQQAAGRETELSSLQKSLHDMKVNSQQQIKEEGEGTTVAGHTPELRKRKRKCNEKEDAKVKSIRSKVPSVSDKDEAGRRSSSAVVDEGGRAALLEERRKQIRAKMTGVNFKQT